MAQKVAEQLVDMLAAAGVKRIYAVTGDSLNEVNDAVRRSDGKLQWIHVRHEEAGAFAAGAEAQLNGLACCAGSSGPGHVHLINGLYDAHRSGAPVIAIASTEASFEFGTEHFQETNTIKLFDDCSCYNQIASTPQQFARMFQAGIQHAISRKGVAVVGLPGDVAAAPAEESMTASQVYPTHPIIRPSDHELLQLADLLNAHQKITLYCGIGAAEAHAELLELAGRLHSPIGYTFRGKLEIQYENPYEVGMTGLLGMPSAYHSMHESDLLVLLGTDFPYTAFMPVKPTIVQIDVRPERLGRRAKVSLGLCGNIRDTLQALMPQVRQKTDDSFLRAQLDFYRHVQEHMRAYVEDAGQHDAIHPEYVSVLVDKLAADDAIFTVDTGMSCVWGARYIRATGRRVMMGSWNHGSMANAMPQAIGAALARPGQQVIALCGDGGLTMLLGDLSTIVQYELPIKIIVFNNRALGMVKLEMEVAGLPDWQTDMPNTDFAAIAQAVGIRGVTVHEPGQVEQALQDAFVHPGPVLVNVLTDPNALAMPPKIEMEQVAGFALSMSKLMLSGRMDEVLDTIKSNYKHLREVL
ncbi:thiamine pyrophosphate-dependent enzyme [Hymenobacter ruricola]|uniref:Ubiquinone-dependent pyruvate dehydrogenase n=1 Tax=Hymenobacter ruricola TaxID=2791023 RepID=A0ABS0I7N8_9BACT|nr:thiamine pyrophosphate-dependent enzyme [Hymenobacter ruricola]MBF9222978.1 ubiquinone-dependent pyruvate dehydrogenase [Hymenobacter ruricola]